MTADYQKLHSFDLPSGLVSLFEEFKQAYRLRNFGIASDIFFRAVTDYPDVAYIYFVAHLSGPVAGVCQRVGRTSEMVALLEKNFENHPYMNLMYWGERSVAEYFIRLREEHIQNGLPSMLLVTQGKSASVSISNLFTSGFHLPSISYSLVTQAIVPAWLTDYLRGGACYVTHLIPRPSIIDALVEAGVKKMIIHVRDPRQTMVSMFHHIPRYTSIMSNVDWSGTEVGTSEYRYSSLWEFFLFQLNWIEGWIRASERIDILFSTFEQFVTDRDEFIERYLDFYGADRRYFNREHALAQHAGTDYHFRKGATDEWKEALPKDMAERMSLLIPAHVKQRFGWVD
jgi:hypothetical protein